MLFPVFFVITDVIECLCAGFCLNINLHFLLGKYIGVEFRDHMVIVCLILKYIAKKHSIVTDYTILNSHQPCMRVSFVPHSHHHVVLSGFFRHCNRYVVVFHCGFNLNFLND